MLITKEQLTEKLIDFFAQKNIEYHLASETIDMIVDSELCGVHTHGVMLLPGIISAIKNKELIAENSPHFVFEGKNYAAISGNKSFGPKCGILGCQLSNQILDNNNHSIVLLKNINHWGRAGYYARKIAKEKRLVFSLVSTSPVMNFFSTNHTRIGNNVFSCAIYQTNQEPLVIDFCTSLLSIGKVHEYVLMNKIPEFNLGLNKNGEPTNKPSDILDKGLIYPFSEFKGTAMSLLISIFIGIFTNETIVKKAFNDFYEDKRASNAKDFCLIFSINIDTFPYFFNSEIIIQQIKENLLTESHQTYIPGDYSNHKRLDSIDRGIYIPDELVKYLSENNFDLNY